MSDHTIMRSVDAYGRFIEDMVAANAITPGELLEISGGDLQAHATADGNAVPLVALEDSTRETAAGTKQIDTDYPAADTVRAYVPAPGELLYMFLAAGENVSKGDVLTSDGAGALKAEAVTVDPTATSAQAVAADAMRFIAWEDVDNSAGTTRTRITVMRI
jgi:hypothetical protein